MLLLLVSGLIGLIVRTAVDSVGSTFVVVRVVAGIGIVDIAEELIDSYQELEFGKDQQEDEVAAEELVQELQLDQKAQDQKY